MSCLLRTIDGQFLALHYDCEEGLPDGTYTDIMTGETVEMNR